LKQGVAATRHHAGFRITINLHTRRFFGAHHEIIQSPTLASPRISLADCERRMVRVALRLGFDVFEQKEISPEKVTMIINTIKAYKALLDAYEVKYFKAAAGPRGPG